MSRSSPRRTPTSFRSRTRHPAHRRRVARLDPARPTMNSGPSDSDTPGGPGQPAVSLLDERIQRWIWKQGWTELRGIQEAAVRPVLARNRDVILAAATAGGKTEAAFFPILTHVLSERHATVEALYIGPLKAL